MKINHFRGIGDKSALNHSPLWRPANICWTAKE